MFWCKIGAKIYNIWIFTAAFAIIKYYTLCLESLVKDKTKAPFRVRKIILLFLRWF